MKAAGIGHRRALSSSSERGLDNPPGASRPMGAQYQHLPSQIGRDNTSDLSWCSK